MNGNNDILDKTHAYMIERETVRNFNDRMTLILIGGFIYFHRPLNFSAMQQLFLLHTCQICAANIRLHIQHAICLAFCTCYDVNAISFHRY